MLENELDVKKNKIIVIRGIAINSNDEIEKCLPKILACIITLDGKAFNHLKDIILLEFDLSFLDVKVSSGVLSKSRLLRIFSGKLINGMMFSKKSSCNIIASLKDSIFLSKSDKFYVYEAVLSQISVNREVLIYDFYSSGNNFGVNKCVKEVYQGSSKYEKMPYFPIMIEQSSNYISFVTHLFWKNFTDVLKNSSYSEEAVINSILKSAFLCELLKAVSFFKVFLILEMPNHSDYEIFNKIVLQLQKMHEYKAIIWHYSANINKYIDITKLSRIVSKELIREIPDEPIDKQGVILQIDGNESKSWHCIVEKLIGVERCMAQ